MVLKVLFLGFRYRVNGEVIEWCEIDGPFANMEIEDVVSFGYEIIVIGFFDSEIEAQEMYDEIREGYLQMQIEFEPYGGTVEFEVWINGTVVSSWIIMNGPLGML